MVFSAGSLLHSRVTTAGLYSLVTIQMYITDTNELILTYTIKQKYKKKWTVVGGNQIPMLRHTLQKRKKKKN